MALGLCDGLSHIFPQWYVEVPIPRTAERDQQCSYETKKVQIMVSHCSCSASPLLGVHNLIGGKKPSQKAVHKSGHYVSSGSQDLCTGALKQSLTLAAPETPPGIL